MDSTVFPTVMIYSYHTIRPCIKMYPHVYAVKFRFRFVQQRRFLTGNLSLSGRERNGCVQSAVTRNSSL